MAEQANEEPFDTSDLQGDLSGRAVRGGSLTLTSQAAKFALQTVSTIVLARLLLPEDFGLIAMVTVVTALAALIKDLGLSSATVQSETVSQDQASLLFWINVGLSALVMVVVAASARLIARFFDEPRLVGIVIALSITFLIGGLTTQHIALMRRRMRYAAIAVVEIGGQVPGVVVAIILAANGWGYWALVIMQLVSASCTMILAWTVGRWRPSRPRRGIEARTLLAFGGFLTGFNFLNYFTQQSDKALIGWSMGAGELGVYSKAYALFKLPMKQLNPPFAAVALPVLSRLHRDPEHFRHYYYRAVQVLAYITIAPIAVVAASSDIVIPLVLGSQWEDASPIFRYLALGGIVTPLLWTAGWVQQARGRPDRMLRWSLITDPIYVTSFVVGINWGARGVALAFAICIAVLWLPTMAYAFHGSPLNLRGFIRVIHRPLILGAFTFAVCTGAQNLLGSSGTIALLASLAATFGASMALIAAWPSLRREVLMQASLVRHLRRRA